MSCVRCERLGPGWAKLRAHGQYQQQAGGRDVVQEQAEQLQGGRIGPVQVFPHGQHRLLRCFRQEPGDQRFLRLLLLALWTQGQRRIPLRYRERQQGGQQRYRLLQRQACRLYRLLQRGQPGRGRHVAVPVQQPLQMVDDRIQGAVGMVRGTVQRQARCPLRHHALGQHPHQTRFANPRLAAEQHHLAPAVAGLRPALPQQRHLCLPAHQRGEPAGGGHIQATLRRTFPHHLDNPYRRVNALERLHPPVLADKVPLHQAGGGVTEHHRVGRGQALETRGQVRGVAQGQVFVPSTAAHLPHHDEPGVDPDPHREPDSLVLDEPRIERPHRRQQLQAGAHGALGIVLMRLRIAEVDEQPIPQILGDMALVALDDRRRGLLVGAHHRAEVFRVELPGEARGVGQVTEQHRELAAFGGTRRRGGRWGGRRGRVGCWSRGHGGWRCPRVWGRGGGADPDEHSPVVVLGAVLDVNEFLLEQGQAVLVQRELHLEGTIGHPPMPLEQHEDLVEHLIERHDGPSSSSASSALASCRSAVSKPSVNQP